MKNKSNSTKTFANIGLSTLMVVFFTLCLTTFAILSLSSAKSDYSLTEKLASHKANYYQASNTAETILADIDQQLDRLWKDNPVQDTTAYFKAVSQLFEQWQPASTEGILLSYNSDDALLHYEVAMDETQLLFITLQITNPVYNQNFYEIIDWRIESAREWQSNDMLHLITDTIP